MPENFFSSEFSTGFQIACGAVTAISLLNVAPYLLLGLLAIPGAVIDVVMAPLRLAEERRQEALKRTATEKYAKERGFASVEAFEKYLGMLKYSDTYVSPSKVLKAEEYSRPR